MHKVMTLGPASLKEEMIRLLSGSADCFRLNSSFMVPGEIKELIYYVRQHSVKKNIPIVVDLQGAKMRIGEFPSIMESQDTLLLFYGEKSDNSERVPVPWEVLFEEACLGDILTLNDRRIKLQVIALDREQKELKTEVLTKGPLSSFKGINREEHPVPFRGLSQKDILIVEELRSLPSLSFALSFIHTGEEISFLRRLTDQPVAAKIERPEAFFYLDKIDAAFDELWLCRGDLGSQAGLERLPLLQREFAGKIHGFTSKALLAGQVLEYMTHFPEPTRSEVVHLYDALASGFAGIVLSDETAIGRNPEKVANFLDSWETFA